MKYCLYIALLSTVCVVPYAVAAKTTRVSVSVQKISDKSKDAEAMYDACEYAACPKGQEFNGTAVRISPKTASCECEKI